MQRGDVSQIAAFLPGVTTFCGADAECALDDIEDWLESGDRSGTWFFSCFRGGRVAGFACCDQVPIARGTFELNWICTDPGCEREGVGALLLARVERQLRRVRARLLVVETSSRPAYRKVHRFLRKNGFRQGARLKDFWDRGDDKLVFEKRIAGGR